MSEVSKYRPDIDGLRAIAVLAVVAFHAAPGRLPGGFIGVDVFFVISGFLISSILLNSLENGKFSILEFYERRIRRIFPALFVVLLTCVVAGWFLLLPSEYKQIGKHIVAGTAFISNFVLWNESGYFDMSAMFKPLLHLWSLGIEEQFYIFWPIILWFAYKKKWSLPLTISILATASFILNIYFTDANKSSAFYLPLPRFWELLVGALLACTIKARKRFDTTLLGNTQSILGIALLAAGFILINEKGAFPGWWVLMPVMGSALMISAGPRAIFNRFILSNRLMVWVGLISYPLYLWHWPILSFMRTMEGQEVHQVYRVIAVVAAIILAWLTYSLVEMPVRRSAHKKSSVFILMGLLLVIGMFGAVTYFTDGFKNRSGNLPKVLNAGDIGNAEFFDYIGAKYYPCTPETIRAKIAPVLGMVHCFQSKQSDAKTVALIGDSHAGHLFIGLAEAMPDENLVIYPTSGLPFTSNIELAETFSFVLRDKNIKSVILSAIWSRKLNELGNANWIADLAETVKKLNAAGKYVYITDDVPKFPFQPSRCKFIGRLGIDNICHSLDTYDHQKFRSAFEGIAINNLRYSVIRTYDSLCHEGVCNMSENGHLLYRDENHLNIPGSKKVGSIIAKQMKNL